MPFIKIKDEKIHYYQSENSLSLETLILLPGATMTGETLRVYADFFNEYNCIALDYPEHGKSGGKSIKTVEEYADFIEEFISVLLKEKVISKNITIAGYSMGGFISIELAIRQIPHIKRMVILNSATGFADESEFVNDFRNLDKESYKSFDLQSYTIGRNNPDFSSLAMQRLASDNKPEDAVCLNDLKTCLHFNKISELKKIKIPTLVIAGDDDRCVPVKYSLKLREHIQRCDLAVLPYIGHAGPFQEFEYYAKIISDFFKHNAID